jgi:anti-anti-sigma regulatory factor
MHHPLTPTDVALEEAFPVLSNSPALVLQPPGSLDHTTCPQFRPMLEVALEQTLSRVMIDLLWVETIDEIGVQTLLFAREQAAKLGKIVTFSTMNETVQQAMERAWKQEQDSHMGGNWQDIFDADLEQFLEKY